MGFITSKIGDMKALFTVTIFLSLFLAKNLSAQSVNNSNTNMENQIRIYPNPSVAGQTLNIESENEISVVEVVDIIGTVVKQQKNENPGTKKMSVLLEKCKPGVYVVKVKFPNNKYAIKKLLIKDE